MAPSSSKLLHDCTVGSPVQVRSETTSLLKYYVISCIDHSYGHTSTPENCWEGRLRTFKLSLRRLEQAGRRCWHGSSVALQSRIYRQFFLCYLRYLPCGICLCGSTKTYNLVKSRPLQSHMDLIQSRQTKLETQNRLWGKANLSPTTALSLSPFWFLSLLSCTGHQAH